MKKLLLFVSLLLATLAAKATEPKIVTFSATNLTHTHVTTALNAKGITTEPWIAVLESSVKTLKAAGITGTFRADYGDARCVNLRSVQGGEGLTSIGGYAFYDCTNLSSISLPMAESIAVGAFANCTSLSTLSLGTALSSEENITFGSGVFTGVTTTNIDLTLGEKVIITNTELAKKLYKGYTFKSIVGGRAVPEKIITFTEANLTHAHVKDSLDKYNIANYEPWIAVLESSVKALETVGPTGTFGAFVDTRCANLQSVQGGEGVTSIGNYAFVNCTNLSSASFPVAESIGEKAFRFCTNLSSASFPVATSIGNDAFYNCSSLSSASFPVVTIISNYAFQNCTSLSSASFPKVTDIGVTAFLGCTSLRTLSLGTALSTEGNITFGDYVFYDVSTSNIDLTLGEKVVVNADGANTNIANKRYKGYTFKSITQKTDTSIDNVQAEGKKVVGYYDLSGVKLRTEPESGIYIVTYDDGTSAKCMKK